MTDARDDPSLVIDTIGRRCPVPVIELARRIGDVPVGAVLAIVADDAAARADIPAWCRMRGHAFVGERSVDGGSAYDVRRLH